MTTSIKLGKRPAKALQAYCQAQGLAYQEALERLEAANQAGTPWSEVFPEVFPALSVEEPEEEDHPAPRRPPKFEGHNPPTPEHPFGSLVFKIDNGPIISVPLTEVEARLMASHYMNLVQGQVALVQAQVATEKVSRWGHVLAAIVTGLIGVVAVGAIGTGVSALTNGGTPAAK
jgi:hypothetical protein